MTLLDDTQIQEGGADFIVFGVLFLAPVVLFGGLTLWLITSHAAMTSLRKRPRLLVDTFDGWRRWRTLVWALPVLGPLVYFVAWVSRRSQLMPEPFEAAREPFPEMPPIRGFVPPTPMQPPPGYLPRPGSVPPAPNDPWQPPSDGGQVR